MKYLTKEIPFLAVDQTVPGTWSLNSASGEGWEQPLVGQAFFQNKQILDLAGLSQQQKTIFFNGIAQQDGYNPAVVNGAAGDSIKVVDLISTVPISDAQLGNMSVVLNFATYKTGIIENMPTWEQTPYMLAREYTIDLDTANWGSMVMVSSNQLGSLQPTASDRLYIYRLVIVIDVFAGTRFDVWNTRFVLGTDPREEKEYQYLMRLKKSYDLQQSFDVDGNRPH